MGDDQEIASRLRNLASAWGGLPLLLKAADRLEALAGPMEREGWVLVPREPTPAMMEAWRQCTIRNSRAADPARPFESPWTAMLSAAPKPEAP
jgi:hypothetical protein